MSKLFALSWLTLLVADVVMGGLLMDKELDAKRCYRVVAQDFKEQADRADELRLTIAGADAKDPLNEICAKDPKKCAVK